MFLEVKHAIKQFAQIAKQSMKGKKHSTLFLWKLKDIKTLNNPSTSLLKEKLFLIINAIHAKRRQM